MYADSLQRRNDSLTAVLSRGCAVIAIVICVGATLATHAMEAIAVANYNPGSWETVVVFGGWNSLAYLAIAAMAIVFWRSVRASAITLTGAVFVSCLSLMALYGVLSPYFVPPSFGYRPMNCAGPAEIVIPFLQLPVSAVFLAIAFVLRH